MLVVEILRQSPEVPCPESQHHGGRPAVELEKQVLITLWYLATQCPIRIISDRFNVTESCVYNTTRRVCQALTKKSSKYIKWPKGERMREVVGSFFELKKLPGVIGLIDGTHLRIPKPKDDPESYINRKKYTSIVLQGICDHELLFTNINCGYPGSVHDGRVLRNSLIYQAASDNQKD